MNSSFCAVTEKAFCEVASKHGFQVRERERSLIVFESASVRMGLFYDDQRSFEVGLELTLKANPTHPAYSFDELLHALNVPASEWSTGYTAKSVDAAETIVKRMASILERHASRLLEADPEAWKKLGEQRRSDCIAYAVANQMVHAKQAADKAWAERNFRKVVQAFAPLQEHLNPSDLKKLEYAKKQI